MALTNAILATPSTLVVPLSAIIDRLQGKLSAADLNALLLSVTGTVKSQVQPGDLISADLMNEILAAIGDLQIRVAGLEGAGPSSSAVRIDGLRAIQPLRVNDPAEIYGAGFLVPALLNTVTMGGLPVANLRGSATQLFFQVPRLAVSSAGTATTVTVVNANGTASSAPIMVLPEPIVPSGQTQLTYTTPPVMPAGQPNLTGGGNDYTFTFSIRFVPAVDNTSPSAMYNLSATCSGTGWSARFIDANQVLASAGAAINVRVSVTAGTGQNELMVSAVEASTGSKVAPGETRLSMAVGSPPPTPESRVRVVLANVGLGASIVGSAVRFQRGQSGAMQFTALMAEGGDYTVEPAMRSAAGWTRDSLDISSFRVGTPPAGTTANQDINVFFTAGAAAAATDLLFTVRRPSDGLSVTYAQGVTVVG